jgi:hypothetical protein
MLTARVEPYLFHVLVAIVGQIVILGMNSQPYPDKLAIEMS